MTNRPTTTPTCQTIELQLASYPDEPYRWGGGHIRPTRVVITTLDNSRTAHLYGIWIDESGKATEAPANLLYRNDDDWPDWLADLADEHRPHVLTARPDSIDGEQADSRADGIDSLRAQLAIAQTQVSGWNARIRELSSMIRQHEQEQP